MQKSLLSKFNKYKKWFDYFDINSFEVKSALLLTVIILIILLDNQIYSNFKDYLIPLQNSSIYIASALIGMLGTILAGIALIISVLGRSTVKMIEKVNGPNKIEEILVSFEFLAFNIGIAIIIMFLIHFSLYSTHNLISIIPFYIIFLFVLYLFLFIIFYTISLISNSIKIFFITNQYSEILENEKTIYEEVNELRIDYILNIILEAKCTSSETFMNDLNKYLDSSNIKDKESVKNYLKNYYDL